VPLLLNYFLEKHCRKLDRPLLQISKATMKLLQARDWPGHVRELENVVERAVISSRGDMFEVSDWISDLIPLEGSESPHEVQSSAANGKTLEQLERDHIVSTLERLHWRLEGQGGAADVLGINASTLRSRMRKHGIRRPGSRPLAPLS
jgi:DNA-binding NtrC family response regulator